MRYQVAVRIIEPVYYLPEKKLSLFLTNLIGLQVVKEFALLSEFHNDEDIIGCIQDLIQFYYIGMRNIPQYLNLSLHLASNHTYLRYHILIFHLSLIEDFNRHPHPRQIVPGFYIRLGLHLTLAKPPLPIVLPNI